MRRLPSTDELTLMAQLVAEARQNLTGLDSNVTVGSATNPTPSIPTLPLGAGFGISFLGLMRRNNGSTNSLSGEALSASTPAQYDIAANPTLTNGNLNNSAGWDTTGKADVNNGEAILGEVSTRQTRLNQVFMVSAQDRYLSFTLSGIALDDAANGPDDAFEVGLLNANTGASLTQPIAKTRTDALLNLQANGTELEAQGVTHVVNADGSRTYVVDLSGIAAGTAVNLSFDLIGFGKDEATMKSHVTVRDVRLLGMPVTQDDVATGSEDSVIQIVALANDTNASQAGLNPFVVAVPTHGQVTANIDGSFSYTPEANFFGVDSFTYRVSDGVVESNVSTIRLTITAVNDIAVAVNDTAVTDQDKAVNIPVLVNDSDIDNPNSGNAGLLARIIANPAHGTVLANADGSLTYTPIAGFFGIDSFTYVANDGVGDSNLASVTITVNPTNRPPVANNDSATLNEDGSIVLGILSNDTDMDGDALTIIIVSQPTHGQLALNKNNTVTYTPLADYFGTDSFSYRLSDGQAVSGVATVNLVVESVNDAPIITLFGISSRSEIFRTGWETARNENKFSTLVQQSTLEGWTLITSPDNFGAGKNGFEIWTSNDAMADTRNTLSKVSAAAGNGANWIELNNSGTTLAQTLGIQRSVNTRLGAIYTLSFDYAGRNGYSTDYTRIGIYVDGVKLATYANTSPATRLNWKALQYTFTGTGGVQTIKFVTEATRFDVGGRGALIDDIALVEQLPANADVPLKISTTLLDSDASEALSLKLQGLPVGTVIADGTRSFTATTGNTTGDITGWILAKLTIRIPTTQKSTFTLTLLVTATESANLNAVSTSATLTINPRTLFVCPMVFDSDGDGLDDKREHKHTYLPKPGFKGEDSFGFKISDEKHSVKASVHLVVGEEVDNRGQVCERAVNSLQDRTATLTLQSAYSDNKNRKIRDEIAYLIVNHNKNAPPADDYFKLNWQGRAVDRKRPNNEWMFQYLDEKDVRQKSLAEITGLKIGL
jgi:hypothetical protein